MSEATIIDRINLPGIESSLQKGCKIHGFRSGGGLRVIRIVLGRKLRGYGEHPHIDEALIHASDDFLAGGRPYKKVYGKEQIHYLTGSLEVTSPLDAWLKQGHRFDSWKTNSEVVVELRGYGRQKVPKYVIEWVEQEWVEQRQRPIIWNSRGYTFESSPSNFPSGKFCVHTDIIRTPADRSNSNPWSYEIAKTGVGNKFYIALNKAFDAEEMEIPER